MLKPAFKVLYGENVPMPVDYALASPDGVHPSAGKFTQHIHTIIKQIQDALVQAQQAQKTQHDRGHQDVQYNVGDQVLVHTCYLMWEIQKHRHCQPMIRLSNDMPPGDQTGALHPVPHLQMRRETRNMKLTKYYANAGGSSLSVGKLRPRT